MGVAVHDSNLHTKQARELPKVPSDTPQAGFERKEQNNENDIRYWG